MNRNKVSIYIAYGSKGYFYCVWFSNISYDSCREYKTKDSALKAAERWINRWINNPLIDKVTVHD